ncbi:alpha/beta fold hydrolase [Georgenia subflava]|uniref:Alpha/beta fold hydrolase n=1 Tax=Georgenia subflava TaxID=1622177 RepID=A0A6N7EB74_9MICO|nr:alpha/beta hydrolase [Georgenia subflava]MPV35632.1 alpha/beta fold hydrolase [Georgenia subflava]
MTTTSYDLPVTGGHLHVEERGEGPPVVLLHGGALDHRMWADQLAVLAAAGYRVVAPDARGHGQSSTPTAPFRQCDDVAALVRHLDQGPVVVVGLSMGGGAAVDAVLEHPHLVRAVVTVGSGTNETTFADPFALEVFATWQQAQAEHDMQSWVDAFLRLVHGPHRTLQDMDPAAVGQLRDMAVSTLTTHVRPDAVAPHHVAGSWDRLGEITVPVLTVLGELDVSDHLEMGRRLVAGVNDGREAQVAGAAHYPPMERPDAFNRVLLTFLDNLAT